MTWLSEFSAYVGGITLPRPTACERSIQANN